MLTPQLQKSNEEKKIDLRKQKFMTMNYFMKIFMSNCLARQNVKKVFNN